MDKYCFHCGNKLTATPRVYGYDENTGKPLITIEYECKNKSIFEFEESHPISQTYVI